MKYIFLSLVLLCLNIISNAQLGNSNILDDAAVGTSWYDLQSRGILGNRAHCFDDGTLAVVWTMGFQPLAFPERGTGYNYFNGYSWFATPAERIESDRCGWPSIASFGVDGEIIVSHLSGADDEGLLFNKRIEKGSGVWEEFLLQGPPPDNEYILFPRLVASGESSEYIHLLCVTAPETNGGVIYQGQDPALLYSRSIDGGANWDPQHVVLEGTGIDHYFGINPDEYIWAEPKGNVIAFLVADAWIDMFIMKSEDNGNTWEKIMVWEHPYPFYDFQTTYMTDTLWAPDNSADIAIDSEGKVHLVCGLSRVFWEPGSLCLPYIHSDGIAYWNEDMPPFEADNQHDALDPINVLMKDYNLVGWMQDLNGNDTIELIDDIMTYRSYGLSTMPSLSIDNDDNLYLAYSSSTEGYDNGIYNFKHIWMRGYSAGGQVWGNFLHLDTNYISNIAECIYPEIAGDSEGQIHLFCNMDEIPGLAVDDDHNYNENSMFYFPIDKSDIFPSFPGVKEDAVLAEDINIFPNPAQDLIYLKGDMTEFLNAEIMIYNSLGKQLDIINVSSSNGDSFPINLGTYGSGVYFLKLMNKGHSITKKVCVVQ